MTLKQFLYLVVFTPIGYIVYLAIPIPLINILFGLSVAAIGVALAFLPINDRPLDIWIRNIWKRLNSPTQFTYHKHNQPIALLQNLYFVSDPHHVIAHIESQQMLAAYLEKTKQTIQPNPPWKRCRKSPYSQNPFQQCSSWWYRKKRTRLVQAAHVRGACSCVEEGRITPVF